MSTENWHMPLENDLAEIATNKLHQAEALAFLLIGERGEAFRNMNDSIQDNVCWLLSDLLTEARTALDRCHVKSKAGGS